MLMKKRSIIKRDQSGRKPGLISRQDHAFPTESIQIALICSHASYRRPNDANESIRAWKELESTWTSWSISDILSNLSSYSSLTPRKYKRTSSGKIGNSPSAQTALHLQIQILVRIMKSKNSVGIQWQHKKATCFSKLQLASLSCLNPPINEKRHGETKLFQRISNAH